MIEYSVTDGLCVLRLDNPPRNAITFELLDELRAAVERANTDDNVSGIVITGGPAHFSAGADVNLFRAISTDADAVEMSRLFQEAFDVVEASSKPVATAVAGKVIGGALELAMACHFRVCDAAARFSMPEVRLGINPGAGGTQRLGRLVGLGEAFGMLLTGRTIDADRARKIGLIDAICDGGELVEAAGELLKSSERPIRTSLRTDMIDDQSANDAAFAQAEKVLAAQRDEIIAPRKIVECVRTGLDESFAAGLLKERRAFVECMNTTATRNRIYLFFATRATAKAPHVEGVAPGKVASAAVVGMGSMGTGIAQALITAGLPVVVRDEDQAAIERGLGRIRKSFEKRLARGRISTEEVQGTLDLITTTTSWEPLAGADIVIEAVFEDVEVKRAVLGQIEAVCPPETIIATNTSTISLDVLAEGMTAGERLVGMHFFNPAHRMPLVEVIYRDATSGAVIATAMSLAMSLGKTPVLVRNREGFLVNRLFIPYLKEAFRLLQEGADPRRIDTAMVEFGFPMGPLMLIDMAGLDILAFTDEVLRGAFPRHGEMPAVLTALVDAGHMGQKTGSGVYRYDKGDYTPHDNPAAAGIVRQVQADAGATPREIGPDEITERLVLRMVNEAFYVLAEQIAQRESDIDAATVLGIGFPDFRGGVLRYARDLGIDTVIAQLEALGRELPGPYRPCELLQEMKGT